MKDANIMQQYMQEREEVRDSIIATQDSVVVATAVAGNR